ncbi:MAG: 4-phosphopantetheinyl transferase [Streptomyces sp.]|nr:4-phosphopantetheinyl transferase [Streptomyces sp.]
MNPAAATGAGDMARCPAARQGRAAPPAAVGRLTGAGLVYAGGVSGAVAAATRQARLLDDDETRRLAGFHREADRDRFLVAHVCLRRLLGECLGSDPANLVFVREPCLSCGGPHGRPVLQGAAVHFSLSHSGDRFVIALATHTIGVDVETVPGPDLATEAMAVLHPVEREELNGLPHGRRPAAFARCWTRKEAVLKAAGIGLSEDPATLYVGTGPRPVAPAGWSLVDLPLDRGHAAAYAARPTGSPAGTA